MFMAYFVYTLTSYEAKNDLLYLESSSGLLNHAIRILSWSFIV